MKPVLFFVHKVLDSRLDDIVMNHIHHAHAVCFILAAPSAPPSSVSATSSSTTITVQWRAVDCIHRNGNLTGYTIQYEVVGSGNKHFVSVSGSASTEGNISGLMPSTAYSIHVAAVNSAGIGAHSVDLTVHTAGS